MTLTEWMEAIEMPPEAAKQAERAQTGLSPQELHDFSVRLASFNESEQAANELHERLGNDAGGFKILSVMLQTAVTQTYARYLQKGIPESVFVDSMRCFTRFVCEHRVTFGKYGFDRWWWLWRQLSLRIFRLGALEFELHETDGRKDVAVHIPSGTDLSPFAVTEALSESKRFIERYCSAWRSAQYVCTSWLLSPALKKLLPPASKIVQFQNRFDIVDVDEKNESYKIWLYNKADISPEDFSENTSLQRAVKQHVTAGGTIGEGTGMLRRFS